MSVTKKKTKEKPAEAGNPLEKGFEELPQNPVGRGIEARRNNAFRSELFCRTDNHPIREIVIGNPLEELGHEFKRDKLVNDNCRSRQFATHGENDFCNFLLVHDKSSYTTRLSSGLQYLQPPLYVAKNWNF